MTTDRDFKRLVRGRMQKTGESYTAARAQLLQKPAPVKKAPPAKARGASAIAAGKPAASAAAKHSPAELAKLAGMSNAAVEKKTGCTWDKWVWALDYAGAKAWSHKAIAQHVHEKYEVPGWWAQTVTVGYERIKGLREKGQRRSGQYEASKSKTFPVPVSRLYGAFKDARTREKWLDAKVTVRTATQDKSVRMTWADGTSVEAWFTKKGTAKSQVAVQHRKLVSKDDAEIRRAYWAERLGALAGLMGQGGTGERGNRGIGKAAKR